MATTPQDLSSIIANSMEKTAETFELPAEETTEETVLESQEQKKEEFQDDDPADDLGLKKADVAQARQLLAGLRDPKKAPVIVKWLAEQAGLGLPETKKEAVEQKKDLVAELKEQLGPELSYLADKMGPVLQKYLDGKVGEVEEKTNRRFSEQDLKEQTQAADAAQEKVYKEYFDKGEPPQEFMNEVSKLIDEYSPKKGQTTESYLRDMLHLAAGRLGKPLTKRVGTVNGKVLQNRTDAASRLASDGRQPIPGQQSSTNGEKKPMTLEESVRKGLEETLAKANS